MAEVGAGSCVVVQGCFESQAAENSVGHFLQPPGPLSCPGCHHSLTSQATLRMTVSSPRGLLSGCSTGSPVPTPEPSLHRCDPRTPHSGPRAGSARVPTLPARVWGLGQAHPNPPCPLSGLAPGEPFPQALEGHLGAPRPGGAGGVVWGGFVEEELWRRPCVQCKDMQGPGGAKEVGSAGRAGRGGPGARLWSQPDHPGRVPLSSLC